LQATWLSPEGSSRDSHIGDLFWVKVGGRRGTALTAGGGGGEGAEDISAHIERLAELKEIGADQFAPYLMHDDEEATLDAYGDEIIPALS
jgi:hypothetical protein